MSITAVMNGYRRPQNMDKLYHALHAQTVKPDDIFLWYNDGGEPWQCASDVKAAYCNHNFKYHGRFAMAQLAQTEYVAIFDDDTIPGPQWFESCLETVDQHPGILGSSGVILRGPSYFPYINAGWNATPGMPKDKIVEVDLVGHAWFFRKEYLKFLWMEEPVSWETCEDTQFSYLAQKYGNIKTYCPPHPEDNKDIWGSTDGQRLGTDEVAESMQHLQSQAFMEERNEIVRGCINRGWKPLYMRPNLANTVGINAQ